MSIKHAYIYIYIYAKSIACSGVSKPPVTRFSYPSDDVLMIQMNCGKAATNRWRALGCRGSSRLCWLFQVDGNFFPHRTAASPRTPYACRYCPVVPTPPRRACAPAAPLSRRHHVAHLAPCHPIGGGPVPSGSVR